MEDGSFGKKNEINSSTSAGMLGTDLTYLREAARMFESTGKFEFAASCYCNLGDFEKAANIYLNECVKIDSAAECFTLAGCYSKAAEVYAKESQFSNCLSVCKKGKLFDKGLQYIKYWKESVHVISDEMENIEQDFLVSGAINFHEHKDLESMMRFVRSFCTMESKRVFLRSLGCLDDLLVLLEEESGHFIEAAELARSSGDILREVDFLEMAGNFKEAALVLLWYVFFSSLWGDGNRGWPLKQFGQKEKLCNKVKLLAKMDSDVFYDFVCSQLKVLSDQQSSLAELKKDLDISQKNESLRGEILLNRKILDAHLHQNSSMYEWEDELPIDIIEHCEDLISQNWVSVRTLVFYWNMWRENVVDIFESFGSFHNEESNKHKDFVGFSLNYFGVRKYHVNGNIVYLIVNKDADWIKNCGQKGLHRDGKCLTVDGRVLVLAMRSYWQSELLSVGIKVLETLEGLFHKSKSNGSAFHQSTSLLHIFEVSKFLLGCQYLNLTSLFKKKLQRFLKISTSYFDLMFPLDWRISMSKDFISLRKTDLSVKLLNEILLQNIDIKGDLTYWTIGRVMMICLSCRQPLVLFKMVMKVLLYNPTWKSFFEKFWNDGVKDSYVARELQHALEDTFRANWKCPGCISPHSFMYLLDRLLFFASVSSEIIFTTRSSLVGWLTSFDSAGPLNTSLSVSKQKIPDCTVHFIVGIVKKIFYNKDDTISWIQRSKIDPSYYHPLLALRLIMILSLIYLHVSDCSKLLRDLLCGGNNIAYLLPNKFVSDLLSRKKGSCLNLNPEVVAEAFISIEDPLLIMYSGDVSPKIHAPCSISVDLGKSKEEIMSILLSQIDTHCVQDPANDVDRGTMPEVTSSNTSPDANLNVNPVDESNAEQQMNSEFVKQIVKAMNRTTKGVPLNKYMAKSMKKHLNPFKKVLNHILEDGNFSEEDIKFVRDAHSDMKGFYQLFDQSSQNLRHKVSSKHMQRAQDFIQNTMPKVDDILRRSLMPREPKVEQLLELESSSSTTQVEETGEDMNHGEETLGEVALENQTNGGNTQEAKNKNGKGNKKGKKGKGKMK